ncbi:hypothetical protein M0802_014649 [Mischocyttarus mexicanus]|nr:hypothetical protein M0802_014649 [Mischocyttarus mexicanus]
MVGSSKCSSSSSSSSGSGSNTGSTGCSGNCENNFVPTKNMAKTDGKAKQQSFPHPLPPYSPYPNPFKLPQLCARAFTQRSLEEKIAGVCGSFDSPEGCILV